MKTHWTRKKDRELMIASAGVLLFSVWFLYAVIGVGTDFVRKAPSRVTRSELDARRATLEALRQKLPASPATPEEIAAKQKELEKLRAQLPAKRANADELEKLRNALP
jgi:hypothetical protein